MINITSTELCFALFIPKKKHCNDLLNLQVPQLNRRRINSNLYLTIKNIHIHWAAKFNLADCNYKFLPILYGTPQASLIQGHWSDGADGED